MNTFPSFTRDTFIRFVVGADDEDADRLDGLFVMSRQLRDRGRLEPHEVEWLDQIYEWFNDQLPCPPFSRCRYPTDAVSWFRASAQRFVGRMWDLAALLREHGEPVRMLKTESPGTIIFLDDYQIVARPWRRRKLQFRC